MRILSVGNMYPPHHLGGYELIWRSAVGEQRARGHEVRVLTTDYRSPRTPGAPELDTDVHRELRWYWHDHAFPRMGLRARLALERHNAAVLDRQLAELHPDVVAWWAMGGMSLSLIERVRRRGLPAVGFVIDDWMVYGPRVDGWLRACGRVPGLGAMAERAGGLVGRIDLGAAATWLFVSEHTRRMALRAGHRLPRAAILHAGIDPGLVRPAAPSPWRGRLLYVGRLDPRKGVDTAIQALGRFPTSTALRVVGDGDEAHAEDLRALARRLRVDERVRLEPGRARHELPAVYHAADVALFPVRWAEPWGLVPLEAMAAGRPVIATGTGGSAEYLVDGENCLLVPPDDPRALAAAIERLRDNEGLRERLRAGGLVTALANSEDVFNERAREALHRAVASRR